MKIVQMEVEAMPISSVRNLISDLAARSGE